MVMLACTSLLAPSFAGIVFIAIAAMLVLGLGVAGRRSSNAAMLMEHRGRVMGIYMTMMIYGLIPLAAFPVVRVLDNVGVQEIVLELSMVFVRRWRVLHHGEHIGSELEVTRAPPSALLCVPVRDFVI